MPWPTGLSFQSIELIEEELLGPVAPSVERRLSWAGIPSTRASQELPLFLAPVPELPDSLEALVESYPNVLTHDIAARFLAGLDSETKALAAMQSMAVRELVTD